MIESRLQFDVLEPEAVWERYPLVVLPDDLGVDNRLASRLRDFVGQGGALVAVHRSGLIAAATMPVKRTQAGGVEVTVPRVPIHEVVSLEVA